MSEQKQRSVWDNMGGVGTALPTAERRKVVLLPDPEPRHRFRPIISVDDHIVEPPGMFEGRLPRKFEDRTPRVVEDEFGNEAWQLEGKTISTIGLSAVVGRDPEDWSTDPARFDEMRPGCWQIKERVRDMDIAGIYASLGFGSYLPGFAGRVFSRIRDQEFGLALMRAWNSWHLEEWAGPYPERIVSCQLPWLNDPAAAAEEIRTNAALGFKAVSFTENPAAHGLPSLHTTHWDPFFKACEETHTVVCLHGGSSGWTPVQAKDAPLGEFAATFTINATVALVDWLWAGIAHRFPSLKIVLSESGISWVPAMMERLDWVIDHSVKADATSWPHGDMLPSEVVRRNFWFCSIHDPIGIKLRHDIGVSQIMLESDYPHSDSSWPDTQQMTQDLIGDIPTDEADQIAFQNAAELFRHPAPASVNW
jgi:predicted TIM-barrel fold metal-dependent hydrolase